MESRPQVASENSARSIGHCMRPKGDARRSRIAQVYSRLRILPAGRARIALCAALLAEAALHVSSGLAQDYPAAAPRASTGA